MNISKGRVLIIEDSPTQAEGLKYILEQNKYDVQIARNGHQAQYFIRMIDPIIVISDVMMPEMNGYEICRWIKNHAQYEHIPVILLTSLDHPQDVVAGLESGADYFIVKSNDYSILLSRMKVFLIEMVMKLKVISQSVLQQCTKVIDI